MGIPRFLHKYFWDVETKNIDTRREAHYVIERILEYGDQRAIAWLFRHFPKSAIKEVLAKRRGFSPRSAHFWAVVLGVPKNKILCLQKQFLKRRLRHWIW